MSETGGRELRELLALSYTQRADLLTTIQREQASLDARRARLLAAMQLDAMPNADGTEAFDKGWTREEVALILRLSSRTARAIMIEATDLVLRFPATLALLERGELCYRQAVRLVEACYGIPDDAVAAAIEERVLKRAPEQSLAQFSASLRRAVATLAPTTPDEQYQDAVAQRRVAFTPNTDGTGQMWSLLPAAELAAIEARLRAVATSWKKQNPADERTGEQRQADALIALLLGNAAESAGVPDQPVSVKPVVNVTVALSTLLALDNQPGELDGHGPIPAALTRVLAFDPDGTWRRLLTDANNRLVDVTAHTYRAPVNMTRLVTAQHRTCCFPGCRRRAVNCEIDHLVDWQYGGATTPANLHPLCARHHHLKHEAGWSVHRRPDGTTIWTSPTGHVHTRPPDELPIDTTTDFTHAV